MHDKDKLKKLLDKFFIAISKKDWFRHFIPQLTLNKFKSIGGVKNAFIDKSLSLVYIVLNKNTLEHKSVIANYTNYTFSTSIYGVDFHVFSIMDKIKPELSMSIKGCHTKTSIAYRNLLAEYSELSHNKKMIKQSVFAYSPLLQALYKNSPLYEAVKLEFDIRTTGEYEWELLKPVPDESINYIENYIKQLENEF